jgi:hypothetical protein
MPSNRRAIGQAAAWLRVGLEFVFVVFAVVTAPVAALLTPRSELEQVAPMYAVLIVAIVAWTVYDLARVIRAQRAAAAQRRGAPPRLDLIWDHADKTDVALTPVPIVGVRVFGGSIQGAELLAGLVHRTWATRLGDQRRDVVNAVEMAMSAVGLTQSPELYWSRGAGVNAAIAGTPQASAIVLGEALLASFREEALLGVLANLLVRLEPGTVRALHGWDPPGILDNDRRMTPQIAVSVYVAADAQVVLALRDAEPLFSALRATATGDPYFPGLTPDQAHLMWTWPSTIAPLATAQPADGVADSVVRLLQAWGPHTERLEMSRLTRIEEALCSETE